MFINLSKKHLSRNSKKNNGLTQFSVANGVDHIESLPGTKKYWIVSIAEDY